MASAYISRNHTNGHNGRYFEVAGPCGEFPPCSDVACLDEACPCRGARLAPGEGYLYISPLVVRNRRLATTLRAGESLARRAASDAPPHKLLDAANSISLQSQFMRGVVDVLVPVLMCEQAACARGLDLDVAQRDARRWWRTGLVPLRATPCRL